MTAAAPAPVLRRCAAYLIDTVLLIIVSNILLIPVFMWMSARFGISLVDLQPNPEALQGLDLRDLMVMFVVLMTALLFCMFLWHAYFYYFELKAAATPGKKFLGLEVVSRNGLPLTRRQCLLREVFRHYCDVPFFFPGVVTMIFSARNQRLGDMVTETEVIVTSSREKKAIDSVPAVQ